MVTLSLRWMRHLYWSSRRTRLADRASRASEPPRVDSHSDRQLRRGPSWHRTLNRAGRYRSRPHHRLMVVPVHRKVSRQRRADSTAAPGGVSIPNRPKRFHRLPGNGTGPLSNLHRHRWDTAPRMHWHNRMDATRPMDGQRMRTITQRRPEDIDHINRAAKAPPAEAAVHTRHPTPAKPTPIRPVPAPIRSPAPPIPRSPHIPRTGRPDPVPIPIRIEAGIRGHRRLPDCALPRNVVPAPIGIQIRPSIALIPCEVVPRRRSGSQPRSAAA